MTTILFLQILFSLILMAATGNLPGPGLKEKAPASELIFFGKKVSSSGPNHLSASPLRPAPPARRHQSRSMGIETSANVAAIVDMRSGLTLFEKRADVPMPLASLTKLMTALVFLDTAPDWDKEEEISPGDLREGPKSLEAGDKVKVKDLFYATLVASENTAAIALSRSTGVDREEFVARMNAKARELGMLDASFTDITGLDPGNTANALDVAVLARAAFSRDEIRSALMTPSYEIVKSTNGEKKTLRNTDRLLDGVLNRDPFKIQGGKTGYIEESGYNFVFEVKGDKKQDLIVVVFGSESLDARFAEAKNLALWAFENFDWEK